jgi:S-formylglutathione hydrolase FrmB
VRKPGAAAALLVSLTLATCSSGPTPPPDSLPGAKLIHFTVGTDMVPERLQQAAISLPAPKDGSKRPLLVLLHGRGGSPDAWASDRLYEALEAAGDDAPDVVMANGGDASYYHDRADGQWGSYVVDEVIPKAVKLLHADPDRIGIGGASMGGFGALDIARLHPEMFCAAGGHSAAIFDAAAHTSEGSFDDAEDFAKHDLGTFPATAKHPYPGLRVWMDVGTDDPFHDADVQVAHDLKEHGADVTFHEFPGGHSGEYTKEHLAQYVAFYARALRNC